MTQQLPDDIKVKSLISQGRKREAVDWCKKRITEESASSNPHLFYLMGIASSATGELAEAVNAFKQAIALNDREPNFLLGLARVHIALKQPQEAKVLLKKACTLNQKHPDTHAILGQCYFLLRDYRKAERACKKSLYLNPQHPFALSLLGNIYQQSGKEKKGMECYYKALSFNRNLKEANRSLGLMLYRDRRFNEAVPLLERALHQTAHDPLSLFALAHCQSQLGMTHNAIASYRRALLSQPHNPAIHCQLGELLRSRKAYTEALLEYQAAINLQEDYAPAYVMKTTLLIHIGRIAEAEALLEEARVAAVDENALLLPRIFLLKHAGDYASAEKLLRWAIDTATTPQQRALCLHHMASLLEKQEYYDRAFDHYIAANEAFLSSRSAKLCDSARIPRTIMRYHSWLQPGIAQHWTAARYQDGIPSPTFLVGFIQSGISLAEQVLFGASDIITIQETPIIDDVYQHASRILGRPITFPEGIASLTDEAILQLRQYYGARLRALFGENMHRHHIVDKSPLNLLHLPLINRLFPRSKVIVMLRDPKDVAINCFTQLFPANDLTVNLTSLEQTAESLSQMIELYAYYRQHLSLDLTEIRYEDMAGDVTPHTQTLFKSTGIGWEDDGVRYHNDRSSPTLESAEETSIFQPAYMRSVGRWRHFGRQMITVLNRLEKAVV